MEIIWEELCPGSAGCALQSQISVSDEGKRLLFAVQWPFCLYVSEKEMRAVFLY